MSSKRNKIKKIIAAGNLKEVLELLLGNFSEGQGDKQGAIQDELIALLARYNNNEKEKINGVRTEDKSEIVYNQIVRATIEIVNDFDEETIDGLDNETIDRLYKKIIFKKLRKVIVVIVVVLFFIA